MKNATLRDFGLLIFRLGVSYLMIAFHGWQKIENLFGDGEIKFADPIGIGVMASLVLATFAEFFCSILIALGILTRWAAIPLLVTMLVAVFGFHAEDPFIQKQLPTLFMFSYALILFAGGGKFSLGRLIGRNFQ